MESEKRRYKRLDLNVNLELERLNQDGITTLKYVTVDVQNMSKSGIGFKCPKKLEVGTYYDAKIQIWTKEIINTVIEIVRAEGEEGNYYYGATFIGLTDTDALKIEIYQIFNDEE